MHITLHISMTHCCNTVVLMRYKLQDDIYEIDPLFETKKSIMSSDWRIIQEYNAKRNLHGPSLFI